ncbi:very short patch repair endonuclease [Luteibacter sp.]|uniref:very short patch repair endonuclease n=1 Tax=Luteibacter sp. TaxID=1886636 RepID=UPI003F7CEB5F
MDNISSRQRSLHMALIRAKDTKPEMRVRRLVHGMGFRYRLHARNLPGTPDLVFPGRRSAIFVHGCFWHHHKGCKLARIPKSRVEFWSTKLERNRERDALTTRRLRTAGWRVMIVWECETRDEERMKRRICKFLGRQPLVPSRQ